MAGWLWPLGGVQDWFEDLWNYVGTAAVNAVAVVSDWVWSAADWINARLTDAAKWIADRVLGPLFNAMYGVLDVIRKYAKEGLALVWDMVKDIPMPWRIGVQALLMPFALAYSLLKPAITWVWDQISPMLTAINDGLSHVAGAVIAALPQGLKDFIGWMSDFGVALWDNLTAFVKDPVGTLKAGWDTISGAVSTGLSDLWAGFTEWGSNALGAVTTMFDGAVAGIGKWVSDALAGVAKALGEGLSGFIGWIQEKFNVLTGWLVGGIQALGAGLRSVFEAITAMIFAPIVEALKPGSPPEPLGVITAEFGSVIMDKIVAEAKKIHKSPAQRELAVAAGAAVLGGITLMQSIGGALTMAFDATHSVKDWGAQDMFHRVVLNLMSSPVTSAILATPVLIGIITPMRQYFNSMFKPEIPGTGDLIRFVVREVIAPAVFSEYMGFHGYSEIIAGWYWEAHWVLPAFTQLVDAFHRGIITDSELNTFIIWHDYSPTARPGIGKSDVEIMRGLLKRLIPRVDLRYAWEMGKITDEELEARYISLGYEEDAALMTEIQMARALVEEIHKVRDEWIRDFLEGYILEGVLRANLAAIGIGAVRIDYYVEYAVMRREREYKADLLDAYWDGYLKDLITYEELAGHATEIIVDEPARDLWLEKAYIRKYKKPKED